MTGKERLRLYGRAWCHLCEEMAQALRALGVDFDEIDVDADPSLEERYGEDVPVLLGPDGAEICRHRLSPEDLSRLRTA